jgi:hypothetical protein
MSTTDMKKEIELKLLQIETRLLEAQGRLAAGDPHEKVEAVSELDFLRHQKQGLESRLAKLDDLLDGAWNTLREWFKEEAAMLARRLDEWIVHH